MACQRMAQGTRSTVTRLGEPTCGDLKGATVMIVSMPSPHSVQHCPGYNAILYLAEQVGTWIAGDWRGRHLVADEKLVHSHARSAKSHHTWGLTLSSLNYFGMLAPFTQDHEAVGRLILKKRGAVLPPFLERGQPGPLPRKPVLVQTADSEQQSSPREPQNPANGRREGPDTRQARSFDSNSRWVPITGLSAPTAFFRDALGLKHWFSISQPVSSFSNRVDSSQVTEARACTTPSVRSLPSSIEPLPDSATRTTAQSTEYQAQEMSLRL
ncbi:hypothetical protein B0T19DRAFT_255033 [Cercophora scortea]|uniref:Uncharacterized protein n=1 Tax=Cercophora scortea TaxID=314031 RepID=A0AAE0I9J9_9PEZI|nr:hypothetical protein B0T19DRAFT_255033 [Cercophora scortea]